MQISELKELVLKIVDGSAKLRNKHTNEIDAPVNYACIFSQNAKEYQDLLEVSRQIGEIIEETPTGPIFKIELETSYGLLQLLKIRKFDDFRPELGDADFTVSNYRKFKRKHLNEEGFRLIVREKFEMIELVDKEFDVRVYFSDPTLDKFLL